MARYRRPRALSQRRDPSEPHIRHENSGCTATAASVVLDFHSSGAIRKRGGDLRHSLPNPDTGSLPGTTLNLEDMQVAWRRVGKATPLGPQTLLISAGWAAMKQRRAEGRMLILQGDSGDLDGSCSESQDVAHAVALHPDDPPPDKSGHWLISDPWCYLTGSNGLGRWRWIDRDAVYDYAKKLSFRFGYSRRQPRLP